MFEFIKKKQAKRSYQQMQAKFQTISDKELLGYFRSENWTKLDNNKRLALVQEVENRNAVKQGRMPCRVIQSDSTSYGGYASYLNDIELHVEDSFTNSQGKQIKNSSYEVLDTIYHEGEHAHQDNCVKNKINPPQGLPKETRDMCEIENLRVTKSNIHKGSMQGRVGEFYNYRKNIDYSKCTCEIDSNTTAVKKIMENGDVFRGDKGYDDYLEERQRAMDKYSKTDIDEVRRQQSAAVDEALDREDIDASRYEDIKMNDIWNNKTQPVFEDVSQTQEIIQQEREKNELAMTQGKDIDLCQDETTRLEQSKDAPISENSDYSLDDSDNTEDEENRYKRR